ncbi:hypothetical protein ACH5RR_015012 [Cinchona calisaya]|uniref:F-box domain-containing protein n=1 Tax=Cinchona calisaya TaxID=153742 RepID=A0ABD2ZSC2_9GENT
MTAPCTEPKKNTKTRTMINSQQQEGDDQLTDSDEEQDEVDGPILRTTWHELEQNTEDDYDDDLERLPRNLKRLKKQVPDRISNCPDSIFLHIQSFLPMEEVIKIGILSKRWKFLWTAATTLNFNYQGWSSNYSISKSVTLIGKTLVRCSVSHVEKIAIGFPYEPRFLYDVYGWMQFANKHSINELEPKFKAPNLNVQYCLPHCVYDNSFMRKLRTNKYYLVGLLGSLKCVENLTIGSWCIQVLSLLKFTVIGLPQLKCKCLTGIELLLQISPNLETAVLDMIPPYKELRFDTNSTSDYNFDVKNYLISRFRHILPLKLIKICGFWEGNTENIIQFAQVMLKNSLMLLKFVFEFKRNTRSREVPVLAISPNGPEIVELP